MSKTYKIISAVLCFILITSILLYSVDKTYNSKMGNRYYDEIGYVYGSVVKNEGVELQKRSAARDDNLFIFGSSELSLIQDPFFPVNFFNAKKDGFQVNLIGRGYSQSITHSVNLGALGDDLKGKKIVYIVSPQWFTKTGLTSSEFNMNFSELQFYTMMFKNTVDKSIKMEAAERIRQLAGDSEYGQIKTFCDLYVSDNIVSRGILYLLMPYYRFKYYLLSVKEKVDTNHLLDLYSTRDLVIFNRRTTFNWDEEKKKAEETGRQEANNNQFKIENSYYNEYISGELQKYKDYYKGQSFLESPEYNDLKLFLDICKSKGIKPLVISVPVNGKWYDYCGFDKEDRKEYYKKVKDMVSSYGFEIADFSDHEYDDYFVRDIMHIGWKGWVYVDEAIDKYFYGNK